MGHSAFRLRGKDTTIVTDPFPPSLGISMGKPTANIVTVSSGRPNHSFVDGVGGTPRTVDGPGEYEIAGILIAGVATSMEPGVGPTNTAFVFRFEDLALCHLGTIKDTLSNQQIEEIGDINVLFVPVGGGNALGSAGAAQVIAQLEPQIIVPMHYHLPNTTVNALVPVEQFAREMGTKEFVAEPKLSVTKSSLGQEVRMVVLENRRV